MKLLLWFALCSFFYVKVCCRSECIARDYGNNGTVCVCNITYCDNVNPITRTSNRVITLYESSFTGLRFRETKLRVRRNCDIFRFGHKETKDETDNFNGTLRQTNKINCNKKYQKINGFGGAFTDSAGINIKTLPNSMQNTLLSDYFSANGIEYSLCRVPIAGTDFSTRAYTYDDVANDTDLSHFSLQKEDFDYKIPYIQTAKLFSLNKLRLFACPWSSPAWMKTTLGITGGTIIGEPGSDYYQYYANYFVKFLDAYKNYGINFWGLTVQNEPAATTFPWNTLGFTPQRERDFIKLNLGPTLERNGYGKSTLKLMFGEDQRSGGFNGGLYFPSVYDWSANISGDSDAAKYVSGVGFHWYYNTKSDSLYILDDTHRDFPQYFILASEACNGFKDNKVLLGSWQRGEAYAVDIIEDLNHFTSGWVDWNMALSVDGGPSWVNNFVDSPIIINASAQEYYKQPMYYALGHFSKFLPPDSVRIELKRDISIDKFYSTAFQRPDNGIVVIAVNTNDESVLLTIELSCDRRVKKEVLPHTIQSYIWWN